jgi:hypothetical protein
MTVDGASGTTEGLEEPAELTANIAVGAGPNVPG